jgi:hypothetical protein
MAMRPKSQFIGGNGVLLTRALFADAVQKEHGDAKADYSRALYLLYSDTDRDGYQSLHRLYMDMADPSEVRFANAYFENYDHWLKLCEADWFGPSIVRWRVELDLYIRARALVAIRDKAIDPADKDCFMANRFLVQNGYSLKLGAKPEGKAAGRAGRPSREAIREAAEDMFLNAQDVTSDLERLRKILPS